MSEHQHRWIPQGPRTTKGSQLVACAEDGCDEIGYNIQEEERHDRGNH